MAVLAFGLAGAAVGGALGGTFLGVSAATWGYFAGSTLGSMLFRPDLPAVDLGPQIPETKVTVSTYGAMIPIPFGTAPYGGNVIFSTDIVTHEVVNVVEVGKGGGQEQTQVSRYFTASFGIGVCETENVVGVRKIWLNGKLWRDAGDDSPASSVLASDPAITIRLGGETQVPSALEESVVGAGNAPAHRGLVVIEFNDLLLTEFGNAIPRTIQVEVVANGSLSGFEPVDHLSLGADSRLNEGSGQGPYEQHNLESAMLMADGKAWVSYQDTTPSHECRIALSDLYAETSTTLLTSAGDHFYLQGLGRNGAVWWKASGGAVLHRLQQSGVDQSATMSGFGTNQFGRIFEYDPDGEDDTLELYVEYHDQAAVGGVQIGGSLYRQHSFTFAGTTATKEQISTGADYTSIFWDGGRIAGRLYVSRRGAANHGFGYVDLETHAYVHLVTFANMPSRGLVGTDGNLYIQSGGANEAARIHKYDQAGALLDYVVLSTGMGATDYGLVTGMVMDDYGNLYVQRSATTRRFWKVETGTMTELDTGTQGTVNLVCGGSVFNGVAPVVTEDGDVFGAPSMLQLIEPARRVVATPPSAATIITALATRSPLVAGDLEVTDLSALTFDGYPVTRQGTIRELVEPLALAGFFDVTESDYKIKFVRRGGAAAVTIPQADLGARVLGASDEPPDPLTTTASGALDYPRMVHVTYMNPAADYQVGKQSSDRAGAGGMQEVNLNLPIVMSDDRARQIADKAKFEFLVAAEGAFDLTTGLDYTRYEPTDIANVTANDVTRRVRFLDRHEGADGVIVWKAVRDLAAVWTQAAPGAGADGQPPQTIPLKGPSEFELLDTHLLRDADDDPGFVLAMKGVTAEWPGGQLYQSDDAGVSWAAVPNGTVVVPAIFGRAVTALATFSALEGNELFDEANVVRVYVGAGVLASYTREQILAGTATGYLIGNELVYARTATLISTGVYDLSGLLRGRNGTEPYMSGHVVGETVVALTGELRSIEQSFADVDVARRYKAVTINQSIDSAVTRSFVNTARRKRPLAPWHAAAGRISASGDLRLKCVRRTRLKNLWRTGSDAPLGEAFERYTWNIYDGADIVRTLESDEPQVDYSAADQTTDFGGVLTTVDFDVAQVSGEYGLGYPTTASVTVA